MKGNLPITNPLLELHLAIEAVTNAGKLVREVYNKDFQSTTKDDKEPITEADIKSDKIIYEIISSSNHPILSEESDDNKKRLDNSIVWIIDPLDGTTDFIKKTGEFTIMAALVREKRPIIGVIYVPIQDSLYIAQENCGAFVLNDENWSKISASQISELEKCRAVGSRHHISEHERSFYDILNLQKFTSRGSSLKVTNIASGEAELYFTTTDKIKQWDTCASYCLIKEAGGNISDMFGNDLLYNTEKINHQNGILVTNGRIHDQVVRSYNQFLKK